MRDIATICPLVTEQERGIATGWVKQAVANGRFADRDWRNGFPRYIWHRAEDGTYWYGFLMNQGAGDDAIGRYKGWPIPEDEWNDIFG